MNRGRMGGDPRRENNPNNNRKVTMDRKTMRSILLRLGGYIFRYKWLFLLALCMMFASNIIALAGPKISGNAIDALTELTGNEMVAKVGGYCILLAILYTVSSVLSYALSSTMIFLSQRIVYTMRKQVFDHLTTLPVNYFDTHATGDIISRISYDIDTVNTSLSHDLLQIGASLVTIIGSLIMMLSISPLLILVFAITVPLSIFFTKQKTKRIRPLFRVRSSKLGELNGYAEEMLSGQKTIKAYNRERAICDRFDSFNDSAVEAYYQAEYHGALIGPSVMFINNLSIALVTTLGGILYMLTLTMGQSLPPIYRIGLGDVSAFTQYSRKFSGPINEFANIMNDLQSCMAAAERVFRLLDEPSEPADIRGAENLENIRGKVELKNIKFGYVPEKTIIQNLDLVAPPGSLTAIVGPTGAGKTTIINLLMRFYDPQSGTITIDNKNINEVTRQSLRLAYTMVLQETWLFHGTIYENITYGKENATMEEVIEAAKAAHIHSYIEQLPDGYQTVLSDDGVNISKGQKQLITIARAMLSDASMLILDEATSNVDSRTEIRIQEAMYSLMKGRTCFVIAHRLSTIQNADTILVLKDGNVIEQGNHDKLIADGGFYSTLYHSQFH